MKYFFDAHIIFVQLKTFRKLYSKLCCNSYGLGQPISHMCSHWVSISMTLILSFQLQHFLLLDYVCGSTNTDGSLLLPNGLSSLGQANHRRRKRDFATKLPKEEKSKSRTKYGIQWWAYFWESTKFSVWSIFSYEKITSSKIVITTIWKFFHP